MDYRLFIGCYKHESSNAQFTCIYEAYNNVDMHSFSGSNKL